MKKTIKVALLFLNESEDIYFSHISSKVINDFELEKYNVVKLPYISNFLYQTSGLKTFSGEELQKKINHLNYFIKNNNIPNIEIKDLKDVDLDLVKDFIKYHIAKYGGEENRESELEIYNKYFESYQIDKNFIGTVIFINHKIVAFNYSYINGQNNWYNYWKSWKNY